MQVTASLTAPTGATQTSSSSTGISTAAVAVKREPEDRDTFGQVEPSVHVDSQIAETASDKYERMLAERLTLNKTMREDAIRSGSDDRQSDNWQAAHGALMDGSLPHDEIYLR
jgi:hypothetical protein